MYVFNIFFVQIKIIIIIIFQQYQFCFTNSKL